MPANFRSFWRQGREGIWKFIPVQAVKIHIMYRLMSSKTFMGKGENLCL